MAKVCLFVWVSARIFDDFTEWYLHRLQTQIPLGVLKDGFQKGPEKTSFKGGLSFWGGAHITKVLFGDVGIPQTDNKYLWTQ